MSHADKANSTTSPLSGQVQNPDFASFRDNRDGWDNRDGAHSRTARATVGPC